MCSVPCVLSSKLCCFHLPSLGPHCYCSAPITWVPVHGFDPPWVSTCGFSGLSPGLCSATVLWVRSQGLTHHHRLSRCYCCFVLYHLGLELQIRLCHQGQAAVAQHPAPWGQRWDSDSPTPGSAAAAPCTVGLG